MNPITQTHNQTKMNQRELEMGIAGTKNSWHYEYKDSAWIFLGGLPYEMTEGDVICMFSQYGEVVHINLIRDHNTGKSKGFGFLCYMDQRSTILAVDNLNGVKVLGRLIRVDHVHQYKLPKDLEKLDQDKRKLFEEGCAPKPIEESESEEEENDLMDMQPVKQKKEKKKKKDKKKKKKRERSDSEENVKPRIKLEDGATEQNGNRPRAKDFFGSSKADIKKEVKDENDKLRESNREGERRRYRSRSPGDRRKRSQSNSRSQERNRRRSRSEGRPRRKTRSRSRSRGRSKSVERRRNRSRSRDKSRDRSRSRDKRDRRR